MAVPELIGLSRADARDALAAAGLVEGDTNRVEDASAPDTVLDQEPAPDTEVPAGSAVDLVLSAGPRRRRRCPRCATCPRPTRSPRSRPPASSWPTSRAAPTTTSRAGNALRTEPEAGTEVAPGSEVTLFVSAGPAPVAVPELAGLVARRRP